MFWIKLIPILGVLGFIGYQWMTIQDLEAEIEQLNGEKAELNQEIGTLRAASATNLQTIETLEDDIERQQEEIGALEQSRNRVVAERDRYLQIFREHDLTHLARNRPGLIEPLINRGTSDVFDQLEQETRELNDRYQAPRNRTDGSDG